MLSGQWRIRDGWTDASGHLWDIHANYFCLKKKHVLVKSVLSINPHIFNKVKVPKTIQLDYFLLFQLLFFLVWYYIYTSKWNWEKCSLFVTSVFPEHLTHFVFKIQPKMWWCLLEKCVIETSITPTFIINHCLAKVFIPLGLLHPKHNCT